MRLSQHYVDSIKRSLQKFYSEELNLYLYGSRTNDNLAGGDIDLVWIVSPNIEQDLNRKKYQIIDAIYDKIGEQKIDLGIVTQEMAEKDPFYALILPNAIKL
jgi:predicted nucleotidyltransferase